MLAFMSYLSKFIEQYEEQEYNHIVFTYKVLSIDSKIKESKIRKAYPAFSEIKTKRKNKI
jgi:hypothetical protein